VADLPSAGSRVAQEPPEPVGKFDRDTAVRLEAGSGSERLFAAEVSPDWRAGRGPHGGYLAAMLLRSLVESVEDPTRAPRSMTIHYARAPNPGPVLIRTVIERAGRSLSTLSARMEQDGTLVALVLSAFSVPWSGAEIAELELPELAPPEEPREAGTARRFGAPPLTDLVVMQPRIGAIPAGGGSRPMEFGAWLGLAEPRPIDAISLAFFSDALIPAPFLRLDHFAPAPTIDLTIHFRVAFPRSAGDERELCFARVRAGVLHEGFFEEDGVIWAADGSVLAQSRQLALLLAA
jgi:acyl-CoA thioesterase